MAPTEFIPRTAAGHRLWVGVLFPDAFIAPSPVRAQAIALYLITIGIAGMLIGPAIIGLLSDMLGGPSTIKYSLSMAAAAFGSHALWSLIRVLANYRRSAQALDQADANGEKSTRLGATAG